MNRPLLLDLFCGAGGAAMGYRRVGFDVIGVDVNPQPNYPFYFVQRDALDVLANLHRFERGIIEPHTFAAIHASPPCHDHTPYTARWGQDGTGDLLTQTRQLLESSRVPWVIENVPGAPMRPDYRLCGCMFNLPGLRRVRWFETSWHGAQTRPLCKHPAVPGQPTITVTGHPGGSSTRDGKSGRGSTADWRRAMDIDWMTAKQLAQAIPPAYTEFIGGQLMQVLEQAA